MSIVDTERTPGFLADEQIMILYYEQSPLLDVRDLRCLTLATLLLKLTASQPKKVRASDRKEMRKQLDHIV